MAKTVAVEPIPNTGIENLKAAPARLSSFLRDVRSEMRKVVSPTFEEVKANTTTVLITVFLFAAYFWMVDSILGSAITALVHKLTTQQ